MKRSEMRSLLKEIVETHKPCCNDWTIAEFLLAKIEEVGMLPPTNECKLVPDDHRGGTKHSETKREWDQE